MTPLRVSSLDADCLLLSNQAKLEAKLESSHAAIISKLDPAFSYHTPTQECLVAKDGDETCTNLYVEIPADFANGKTVTGTLKVGPAVTSIGARAFEYTDLTGLDLSDATALQTIGDYAFYNTQLTGTLKVGPAVTSIGDYAFQNTYLKELDISEATALTTIGEGAFYDTQLTGTLKVGPAVTSIGEYAFYDTQLTGTLKLGPAVTSIGTYAFAHTGVTELDISEATALKPIGYRAFYGTPLYGQTVLKADGTSIRLT